MSGYAKFANFLYNMLGKEFELKHYKILTLKALHFSNILKTTKN